MEKTRIVAQTFSGSEGLTWRHHKNTTCQKALAASNDESNLSFQMFNGRVAGWPLGIHFSMKNYMWLLCPQAFLTAMMAPSCQGSKYQYLEETQVDGSMASKTDVKQAAWDPRGLLLNYYSRWKGAWAMKVCMLSNCDITESLLYQERNHNFFIP